VGRRRRDRLIHSTPVTGFLAVWRIALPGFAAILVGVGMGRFAYTAMIPVMVADGWLSVPAAANVGAGNMLGYLVGALTAHRIAAWVGLVRVLRASLVLCLVATIACAWPSGAGWIGLCRFATGVGGALLMVLGTPILVGAAPPALRGGVSGAIFTGVGLGMALSGVVVPRLEALGSTLSWLGIGALTALAAAFAWRGWPAAPAPASEPARRGVVLTAPLLLLMGSYSLDAIGFMPHAIFWVDFVARGLGRGVEAGGHQWILFGVGAALGPVLCGRLADRIGFPRALLAAFALKTGAVWLPLVATDWLGLGVSSLLVGALIPGIAALTSGCALELLGPAAHAPAWRWLTIVFSLAAAAGGYLFAFVYAATGSYLALFALGGAIIAAGGVLAAIAAARPRF
jgi:predicted MFS family arabinose efflux permease